MTWNFNIDEAPKGKYETKTAVDKNGKEKTKTTFLHDKIIAAGKCGVVTVSYWNDPQQRWNMFGTKEAPMAWKPWPTHPDMETKA